MIDPSPHVQTGGPGRLFVGIDASRGFGARPTGTETYTTEVVRALAASDRFRLRLYTRSAVSDTPDGVEVSQLGPRRLWTHVGLGWEVVRRPPDVLFVPAHVLPMLTHPPAAVTVHDLGHKAFPEAHTRAQVVYLEWSMRRHARKAARLIADSQATKRDLENWYGVPPDRIAVAPLGVAARFRPAAPPAIEEARRALGLPVGRRYVLHVGTLQPRKNLLRLVRAFATMAAGESDLDLVLAGAPGWGHDDPAAEARRHGLGDRVRVVGYLDAALLPGAYSGAVATALPSLYEGFGLTAAESMACGTPVAGSSTSSVPEVIGAAGLLFDPLDVAAMATALVRLSNDAALRNGLARAALERAPEFSWNRCAAAVAAALEQAAGVRPAA